MWKGFVGDLVHALETLYLEPLPMTESTDAYDRLIRFGCFGVAIGMAVAITIPAILTAFLPPGATSVRLCPPSQLCASYVTHLCGHLIGATALPFAYGWYLATNSLLLLASSPGCGGRPEAACEAAIGAQQGSLAGLRVGLAMLVALIAGVIKYYLTPPFARLEQKAHAAKEDIYGDKYLRMVRT